MPTPVTSIPWTDHLIKNYVVLNREKDQKKWSSLENRALELGLTEGNIINKGGWLLKKSMVVIINGVVKVLASSFVCRMPHLDVELQPETYFKELSRTSSRTLMGNTVPDLTDSEILPKISRHVLFCVRVPYLYKVSPSWVTEMFWSTPCHSGNWQPNSSLDSVGPTCEICTVVKERSPCKNAKPYFVSMKWHCTHWGWTGWRRRS